MISVFGFDIDCDINWIALLAIGLYALSFVWIAIVAIRNYRDDKKNQQEKEG